MSRMVIDDVLWERLQKLLPKPNGRHGVERFFQKIKRFRRIATRYDKTARMYLTGIMFVSKCILGIEVERLHVISNLYLVKGLNEYFENRFCLL